MDHVIDSGIKPSDVEIPILQTKFEVMASKHHESSNIMYARQPWLDILFYEVMVDVNPLKILPSKV